MSASIPLFLGFFSAITVALANFCVKRGGDVLTTRMVMSICVALTLAPFAFFTPLPHGLWGGVTIAVVVHWFYQFAMIKALHRGALSLVFPVMRGGAPLLTAALAYVALNESLSPWSIAGLVIASISIIVFAIPAAETASAKSLDAQALVWALLTSAGIAAYSVVDAHVARQAPNTMTFVVWLFLFDWIGVTVVACIARRGRLWRSVRPQLKNGAIAGVLGAFSYGAAIFAFTMTDTAIVTALRETSVVFAALLGWAFLKEGFGRRRIAAAVSLAAGLTLIQVYQ